MKTFRNSLVFLLVIPLLSTSRNFTSNKTVGLDTTSELVAIRQVNYQLLDTILQKVRDKNNEKNIKKPITTVYTSSVDKYEQFFSNYAKGQR